jgi:signal transduction histidine kinase
MPIVSSREGAPLGERPPRYALVAFALIVVSAIVVVMTQGDDRAAAASLGVFAGNMAAGLVFVRSARSLVSRERRAWSLIGSGLVVAATGIVAVVVVGLVTGGTPSYGPTDLFFLAGYVLILVGIASLPHTEGDRWQRSRIALDGVIGAVAFGALGWVFVIDPVVAGLDGAPVADRVFGTLYPLLDIGILLVVVTVTFRRSILRFDPRMILLSGAVLLQAVGDLSLLVSGLGKTLGDAEPLFLVYLAAATLFLVTALSVDRLPPAKEYADRRTAGWALLLPYSAVVVMIVALIIRLSDSDVNSNDAVLLIATVVTWLLVSVRQSIAIRENRMLVEQQQSDLVSSISHELRTPLTAMVGFLEIVKEDSSLSKDERIEMIEIVAEQATYLERIVEDLLALAHGTPDRMDLDLSECNIDAIIENAVHAIAINRRNVEVEVKPVLTAVIDGNRIQQVLVNLLSNAARYGGDRCLVAAYSEGSSLVIEVHDSGPGVPKKHEISIWERFERGQNRYNAAVPGSGIGLAMVKSIAEAHGGRASYRRSSRLGGSRFVIELPGRVGGQESITVAPTRRMAIG